MGLSLTAVCLAGHAKSLGPETYTNPLYRVWGTPDPTVARGDNGHFYIYTGTGGRESVDMVNWWAINNAMETPTWNGSGCGLWASDLNKVGDKWVYYYCLAIWGDEWVSSVGRAVGDNPWGPFTDLGCLFTSQGIGVKNSIDQCLFQDDDGRKYLFWGSFSGIYAYELTADGLYLKPGCGKVKVAGDAFEGTMIHKRNGYYYLLASTGTCCENENSSYTTVVGRATNVLGPYTDRAGASMLDNNCHFIISGNRYFAGMGHNSQIISDDAGNDWIYYHGYDRADVNAGRLLYVDRVEWIDDWPVVNGGFPSYYPISAPYVHDSSYDPRIETNESTLWFTINKDQSVWRDLVVSTANITESLTVSIEGDNAHYFTVDHSTLPAEGGTLRVTYTPDWNVGAHRPSLVLRANGTEARVLLRGTSNDATSGGEQPTLSEIGTLQNKWLYSTRQGNLGQAPWFSATKPYTRSMTVIGNNLYILSAAPYNNEPSLTVVDASTGTQTGTLSLNGLPTSGQLLCAGALGHLGDQLIMSNAVQSAAHTLYIYKWNNNSGDPVPMLTYSNANLGIAYGEVMGVWGDMNNGKIAFGNEEKVVIFNVKDGAIDANPTVVTLPQAITESKNSPRGKFEVRFNDDGTFWHTSYWTAPTRYRIEGTQAIAVETIPTSALNSVTGTAARFFNYGNHKYAAVTAMQNNYIGGHMQLIKLTDGVANATSVGAYPEQGLGDANWTASAACTQVEHQIGGRNNAVAKFWVMVPEQGIAHYEYYGATSDVSTLEVDDSDAPTEYYTLQGIRVTNDILNPGIYIMRRGASVRKIVIR